MNERYVLIDITTFSITDWQLFLTGNGYSSVETAAILTALHPNKVTSTVLETLLTLMQAQATGLAETTNTPMQASVRARLMDCCGTGGSGRANFNTSTTVAFVLAAGGIPILKFGNRAASSPSGSFDFLEGLGLPLAQLSAYSTASVEATGLGFLFAPDVYPALKPLAVLRKTFGKPTVFNFLGPLLNPFQPPYRLLGCSNAKLLPLLAQQLALQTTCTQALVLRSNTGLDEALPTENATGIWLKQGNNLQSWAWQPPTTPTTESDTTPLDFSVTHNVAWFRQLIGVDAITDLPPTILPTVTLNAGLGFWVANKVNSVEAGIQLASNLLAEGTVRQQYQRIIQFYQALGL